MLIDRPILFLKATTTKKIIVPGYTRHDGVFVPPHEKVVHYNPDTPHSDIMTGSGKSSSSQKKAHGKLSKLPHWTALTENDQLMHILSSATNQQNKASASAAVSQWKAAMLAGKKPTASQQAAFDALPEDKQAALLAAVGAPVPGSVEHKDAALQEAIDHLKEDANQGDLPADEKAEDAELVAKLEAAVEAPAPEPVEPAPAPSAKSKLSDVPWESFLLADSNTNAATHNKAVNKIKAMAEAGDLDGLQAFADSKAGAKQTYAKKQGLIAQLAIVALKEDGESASAPAVEPAPAAPEPAAAVEPVAAPAHGVGSVIEHEGAQWKIVATGATKDGTVYTQLASVTEGKQQKNGFVPKQMADWLPMEQVFGPAAVEPWPTETFTHSKKGHTVYAVPIPYSLSDHDYKAAAALAKKHGGFYSSFAKDGAIKGFHFKTAEAAAAFGAELIPPRPKGRGFRLPES